VKQNQDMAKNKQDKRCFNDKNILVGVFIKQQYKKALKAFDDIVYKQYNGNNKTRQNK